MKILINNIVYKYIVFFLTLILFQSCSYFSKKEGSVDKNIDANKEINKVHEEIKKEIKEKDDEKKHFETNGLWLGGKWEKKRKNVKNYHKQINFNANFITLNDALLPLVSNNISYIIVDPNKLSTLKKATFSYSGNIAGFIRKIEEVYGVYLDVISDYSLEISIYKNKIFNVNLITYKKKIKNSSSFSDDDDSSTTDEDANDEDVEQEEIDQMWEDVKANLEMILQESGSFTISKSTSSISVFASKRLLQKVESYITDLNKHLSQQVSFDVQVYSLTLSEVKASEFSLNILYNKANKFNVTTAQPTTIGSNVASGVLTITSNKENAVGSNLIFERLNDIGKTSVVESTSAITTNARSTPINLSVDTLYIKESSVVSGESTTGQATDTSWVDIETEAISTGFNMLLTPKIIGENQVLVSYDLERKELLSIKTVGDEETSYVQIPEIARRYFSQQVILKSNQSLMIAGYQTDSNNVKDRTGLFGFEKENSNQKQIFIIVITPKIIKI